ncbi:type VI secretion lipoprotein/VasD [Photobacterium aphoticum]|uniref:Type VI secretion lipoprotein/VasD n=1 Tax=Photobacterium aphoticum TaxID=754436 RepID=A0A090QRU9_9GAMM|nr:type VI secretion lipoprotein/VasD [Photobacterium aphoticum]
MASMKKMWKGAALAASILALGGCGIVNAVMDPYTKLNFDVAENVNPDMDGRPSPVVVKVFELSSRTLFDSQDFFELYDDPKDVLGPDLIAKNEFEFSPGTKQTYELTLSPGTRYAGVLVAYQDLENARWREVIEVDTTAYDTYNVLVGELSVFVSE